MNLQTDWNPVGVTRGLINQYKERKEVSYVRVTANDVDLGDQYLLYFLDNEKTIPTILTTSQKLSTGVDVRNNRNIVLMRPVNTIFQLRQSWDEVPRKTDKPNRAEVQRSKRCDGEN